MTDLHPHMRLAAFKRRHPGEWVIGEADTFWQARRPDVSGETVLGGYTLGELMDKLEALERPPS